MDTRRLDFSLSFIQVNLYHAKRASAVLSRSLSADQMTFSVIQEPWADKAKVRGLSNTRADPLFILVSKKHLG